jgi:hypothetical protein
MISPTNPEDSSNDTADETVEIGSSRSVIRGHRQQTIPGQSERKANLHDANSKTTGLESRIRRLPTACHIAEATDTSGPFIGPFLSPSGITYDYSNQTCTYCKYTVNIYV